MAEPAPRSGDGQRPRTLAGLDPLTPQTAPEPSTSSGRPTTRAFTRRPMPGAVDGAPPPPRPMEAPPGTIATSAPTRSPTVPPMPVANPNPGARTTAPMQAFRPPSSAPTQIMPLNPVTPGSRITTQMPAIRSPGNAPTQMMPAMPANPPARGTGQMPPVPPAPLHISVDDDPGSVVKTRTAQLRSEATATQSPRTRRPASLNEGTPAFPSGAGGWTADIAPSTRSLGSAPPPPSKQGRPRYWMSTIVYVVLIAVVGGVSIWGSLFFWGMNHPLTGHDVDYTKANCPWLPPQATHISYRVTPMSHAAIFTIDESDFLAWTKKNGFQDLGNQQTDGTYQLSTQHAVTVVISPDEVVRGDATYGDWFEKRAGNLSGYTVAYDRYTGIAFYTDTKSMF